MPVSDARPMSAKPRGSVGGTDNLISPSEMLTIERVLDMGHGYVLDFSDRTFDMFFQHHFQIDASAPLYLEQGTSKANRLRSILGAFRPKAQADLLTRLLEYRDEPAREGQLEALDPKWRTAYERIVRKLALAEARDNVDEARVRSSAWTGRRTIGEQVHVIRGIVPLASAELAALAEMVEQKRYNDPVTADAVACLRELHAQIGELLEAVDRGDWKKAAVVAIENNRRRLVGLLGQGAKIAIVAPAMTVGVIHLLALLTGVGIDTQLVGTVYASLLGADTLKALSTRSSLAGETA